MGITAENLADRYGIGREDQDRFAQRSHRLAAAAQQQGRFVDEIVPVSVSNVQGEVVDRDEGVRPETTIESLAKLQPVFRRNGTVTAGNCSQTTDGSAGAIIVSEAFLKRLSLPPLARFASFAVRGVPPEIMGIGPVEAVPVALKRAGLALKDLSLIELNEAFAVQVLAVMRDLDCDQELVNVNGGAIALGHPLGATGAKLTATLLTEMRRRQVRYGMVTMCIGGGMGAAGIFEAC